MSWALCGASALVGCNIDNPGIAPPPAQIAYPVGLQLSQEEPGADGSATPSRFLFVANSNFDLLYNAGSVHSYDLERVWQAIDQGGCLNLPSDVGTVDLFDASTVPDNTRIPELDAGVAEAGTDDGSVPEAGIDDGSVPDAGAVDAGVAEGGVGTEIVLPAGYNGPAEYGTLRGVLCDGRDPAGESQCCFPTTRIRELGLLRSEVLTDSFASSIALSPDGNRVYVPIRSKDRLLYLDVNDGVLDCGGESGRCKQGPNPSSIDEVPNADFAPQPNAIAVGRLSDLSHPESMSDSEPSLKDDSRVFVATAHDLGQVSLFIEKSGVPVLEDVFPTVNTRSTSIRLDDKSGFLYVTANSSSIIERVAVRVRQTMVQGEMGDREELYSSSPILFSTGDIRDVKADPKDPTRLFALVSGLPQALQVVSFLRVDSTTASEARVIGNVKVGAGPSKLTLATLGGRRLLLASCYDARAIFVIDIDTRELISVIRGPSGPFDIAVDEQRQAIYAADFRASVVRVIDVRGLVDRSMPPPRIVATLGQQRFAGGLK